MYRGDYAGAIAELEGAARYLTNNASLRLRLGICYYSTGEHERARAALRETIALRDSLAQAYQIMGRIAADEGAHEEAETWYRRAIVRDAGDAQTYELMGWSLERLGRRGEAIAAYRKAVQLDPGAERATARLAALGGRKNQTLDDKTP